MLAMYAWCLKYVIIDSVFSRANVLIRTPKSQLVKLRINTSIPNYTIIANFMPDVKLFFGLDINLYLC